MTILSEDETSEAVQPEEIGRLRQFLRHYHLSVVIGLGFTVLAILFVWTSLPSPYNPRYLINRALKDPSFVCRDDTYSFAATPQGACSGHGGIKRWMPRH